MSKCYPCPIATFVQTDRTQSANIAFGNVSFSVARLPTDPLFYADLTLQNIVIGSRYRVTRHDNGEELTSGVASDATEVLSGLPVYSNPMLVDITVRNASNSPYFRVFDTSSYIIKTGGTSYIFQQLDE